MSRERNNGIIKIQRISIKTLINNINLANNNVRKERKKQINRERKIFNNIYYSDIYTEKIY